jgi:hypothetical protein
MQITLVFFVRAFVFVEMTVGGTILFKTKKGDLQYYVVALCSHEVESIGKVFINEDESTNEKYKGYSPGSDFGVSSFAKTIAPIAT